MIVEGERLAARLDPSEHDIKELVLNLRNGETSFVSITDDDGNYIQIAGSRPWCLIEHRSVSPLAHHRAYQNTPIPKYKDGAKLNTGAGSITLKHDEWFLLKDAADVAVAFLHGDPFPAFVKWRQMNEMLGI